MMYINNPKFNINQSVLVAEDPDNPTEKREHKIIALYYDPSFRSWRYKFWKNPELFVCEQYLSECPKKQTAKTKKVTKFRR